jgi:two-component system chemotaxis response regulator CheY
LRQIDRFAQVIVATADVQSSTRELADQEGAYRVLNKPIIADQLLDAVQMALQERKAD